MKIYSMKVIRKSAILVLIILMTAGCGNGGNTANRISNENQVDKALAAQMEKEQPKEESEDVQTESETQQDIQEYDNLINTISETQENSIEDNIAETQESDVDYDLTKMSKDMVYSLVYQIMVSPDEYEGKTFRINGNFYSIYFEPTQKYYYYCIIQDATACCTQGMEFIWDDGSHIYPDEYPQENEYIIVEGTFETYKEEGDDYLYCRLADASLKVTE